MIDPLYPPNNVSMRSHKREDHSWQNISLHTNIWSCKKVPMLFMMLLFFLLSSTPEVYSTYGKVYYPIVVMVSDSEIQRVYNAVHKWIYVIHLLLHWRRSLHHCPSSHHVRLLAAVEPKIVLPTANQACFFVLENLLSISSFTWCICRWASSCRRELKASMLVTLINMIAWF